MLDALMSLTIADDVHEALLVLVEGKAQPPVKERTRAMRAAAVRYGRAGGKISVKEDHGDKALYYEGRRLLKSSEVNKVVVEEFCKRKLDKHGIPFCAVFVFYLYVNYSAELDVYRNCGSLRDFLTPHARIVENSHVTNLNGKLVCKDFHLYFKWQITPNADS